MGTEESAFQELIYKFRWQIVFCLAGLAFIGAGLYITKTFDFSSHDVVVLGESKESENFITVDVSGAILKPGVYQLVSGSRIADAIAISGGLEDSADTEWIDRMVNKAAKLSDGQKVYIPFKDDHSDPDSDNLNGVYQSYTGPSDTSFSNKVSINTASQSELESLWGIGPKTAQKIIEQRPYSSIEELLSKKIINSNVFDKNKDIIIIY